MNSITVNIIKMNDLTFWKAIKVFFLMRMLLRDYWSHTKNGEAITKTANENQFGDINWLNAYEIIVLMQSMFEWIALINFSCHSTITVRIWW